MVSHLSLTDIVKGTCGLVKQQYGGIGNECPCNQNALLLSAAEVGIALTDHGLHLHWHLSYVVGNARKLRSTPCVIERTVRRCYCNVAEDVAGKEAATLQAGTDEPAKTCLVTLRQVVVVVELSASVNFSNSTSPEINLRRVVFPQPEGPTIAT